MTQALEARTQSTSATFTKLKCKECGAEYELEAKHVCDLCFGPVEVVYDYEALRRNVTRETGRMF